MEEKILGKMVTNELQANIDRFRTPNSSISASRALFALVPIPITAMTAAVPIIIAKDVKKDLKAFALMEFIADSKDSLKIIILYL